MIESEETTQNISSTIFKPKQTFNETSYTEIYNNDKQNKKNNFMNNFLFYTIQYLLHQRKDF